MIPARGGSKGLPRKALLPLGGVPLIAHSIELARRCPEIERTIVTTDDAEIAAAAQTLGAEVPFLRPAELARDDTPMWPVLRHALGELEQAGERWDALLLLQPTSPFRLPEDVAGAARLLASGDDLGGVVGVSEPRFNPIWSTVVERDGRLAPLVPEGARYDRRQDVPRALRINGSLYLWRSALVRERERDPGTAAPLAGYEIPELRALDVDTAEDLALAELLLGEGLVRLPWLG